MTEILGGPAKPIVLTTDKPGGGPARLGYLCSAAEIAQRGLEGGPATPAYLIDDDDLLEHGGSYFLDGGPLAQPVYQLQAGQVGVIGGSPLGLYVPGVWHNVTLPIGWTWTLPFTIERNYRSFRPAANWDVSSLAPVGAGKAYYVNPVTGLDTNDGSAAHPLKRVKTAIALPDIDILYVMPGFYSRDVGWQGVTLTRSLAVYIWPGQTGKAIFTNAQTDLTWVLDGTLTHTYKATRSSTFDVIDASQVDANGHYVQLTLRVSAAQVEANPGSWYMDGSNVVWVRTIDDRAPDANLWPMVAGNVRMVAANQTLYMENIQVYGSQSTGVGVVQIRNTGAGQTTKFYAKNCDFAYSRANGLGIQGASEVILQNCRAFKNVEDGFNHHSYNTVIPQVIEINCSGFDNGTLTGEGNDNGSSIHEAGAILRLSNGAGGYYRNVGPNVADVDGSLSWNLGIRSYDSLSDVSSNWGFEISGAGGIMWLDHCTASGNTEDLQALVDAIIKRRACVYATAGGAGTYQDY